MATSVDLSWGRRGTGRKPGPAPRRGKGGRERTKQRKNPQPTPEKTSTDTILASDRAKNRQTSSDSKSSLPKIYPKTGAKKSRTLSKRRDAFRKKSCQKTDSISPSQISKTQPQPLPQPVSKSSLPKIYPKTGAKKSRTLSKRGDAFRKKSCQKTDSISPFPDIKKLNPNSSPNPSVKEFVPKNCPNKGAKNSRTQPQSGDVH